MLNQELVFLGLASLLLWIYIIYVSYKLVKTSVQKKINNDKITGNFMCEKTKLNFILSIIASLIAAIIFSFIAFLFGKTSGYKSVENEYKKIIEAAPSTYAAQLDSLIKLSIVEGHRKVIINARAIVATRNDLQKFQLTIANLLNSEIDSLGKKIIHMTNDCSEDEKMNLFDDFVVLDKKWPSKRR